MSSKELAKKIQSLRRKFSILDQEEFHQKLQEHYGGKCCNFETYKKFEAGQHLSKALIKKFCAFVKASKSEQSELEQYLVTKKPTSEFDFANRLTSNFPHKTHANFSGYWIAYHYNFSNTVYKTPVIYGDIVVIEPGIQNGFFECHRYYGHGEFTYDDTYSGKGCYVSQQGENFAFLFLENSELCLTTIKPPLPGQVMRKGQLLQGMMLSISVMGEYSQCVPSASRVLFLYLGKEKELIESYNCDDRDGLLARLRTNTEFAYEYTNPEEFPYAHKISNNVQLSGDDTPFSLRAWDI